MSSLPGDAASVGRVAAGLSYVCGHIDELRAELGDDGTDPGSPLQVLLAAMRSERSAADMATFVEAVHVAVVRATSDPWGIFGDSSRGYELVGVDPIEIHYRCPKGLCAGRSRDEVIGVARCAVTGQKLLRERRL
jgi:hypothetical protein